MSVRSAWAPLPDLTETRSARTARAPRPHPCGERAARFLTHPRWVMPVIHFRANAELCWRARWRSPPAT